MSCFLFCPVMGSEYFNKPFSDLMKDLGIKHFATWSSIKASIIERTIQVKMKKIARHMTRTGKKRYIDHLDQIIDSYNLSYNRSIKMAPTDVSEYNLAQVFKNLYSKNNVEQDIPKLKIGDVVRLVKSKSAFSKGYSQSWSKEVYTVRKVRPRKPVVYYLRDSDGNNLEGSCYYEELQLVH